MILVTGGTGFVGQALGDVLSQGRRPIALLSRQAGELVGFETDEVRFISGDVCDGTTLASLAEEVSSIIHLAGCAPGRLPPKQGGELAAMDRLLEAFRGRIDRFVFLSATGADSRSPVSWLRDKGIAEQRLQESGMPWCILRAGPVFAEEDRIFNAVGQAVQSHSRLRIPFLSHGALRPISAGDVSIALATALDHHELKNRVVEVGGPEVIGLDRLLGMAAERLGKSLEVRRRPWGGTSLTAALQSVEIRPLEDAATVVRWFSLGEPPAVAEYDRALPMRRASFAETLRAYPWGPPPPRPGDPLPVLQPKGTGLPPFIPGPHLREAESELEDISKLGRVDPFGKPESPQEENSG